MRPAVRACVTSLSRPSCHSRHLSIPVATQVKRYQSDNAPSRQHTFEGYIADKLDAPLWSVRPQTRTQPEPPPPDELPMTAKEETLAKARVVFGSRLAGPVERREQIEKLSTNVAGIMVPPKPEEPENCCMSGCVNCVWDRYRDELEEWAEMSGKARAKLNEQRAGGCMGDDGGGSEVLWDPLGAGGSDLFADIPVGIREFMKVEKKLKERKRREAKERVPMG
jgi:hypothetical protein